MFKWLMVLLLLLFVYHVREVFPPFIVGAIIAYLLYPLVKFLNERCGFRPFWSVLLIYCATGVVVGFLAWHFWPALVDEAQNLFETRREIVTNLVDQVRQQFSLQLDVHDTTELILNQLQNSIGKPEEILHFGGIVSKSLLSILVCAVTSVYMLADNKRVGRFFMRFVAPEKRATVVSLAGQMDVMFRKYVLGQLGLITLMSFIAFCILSCCGIKYALLIALVTGFLEIIPVLGPLLAIIIASVFAVAQLGIGHFWIVPLWYWIARLLEDYVIVPNTIGHAVELHPLAVIFAVVVGETMAGALGMLIAIPVAASIKVVLDFCYPPATVSLPSEHKSPMDKLFNSILPSSKKNDPAVDKVKSDIETIRVMHEGAQGIAPHALLEKTADERNVINTASGSTNPIPGELPQHKTAPEPVLAAHVTANAPAQSKHTETSKGIPSRANDGTDSVKPVTMGETLTGMAARVKREGDVQLEKGATSDRNKPAEPEAPKTEAPKTAEGSKSEGSKSEGSKTEGSKTDGSKTESSKTEGSKTEGSKTEGSKTEGSQTEGPKKESDKTERAKTTGSKPSESETQTGAPPTRIDTKSETESKNAAVEAKGTQTTANEKTTEQPIKAPAKNPQEALSQTTAEPAAKAEANPKPATASKKDEHPQPKKSDKKD